MLVLFSSVAAIDQLPDDCSDQQRGIREHEYPVIDQPAVDEKTGGCNELADEEPTRDAFDRVLTPLAVDLPE